jgi:hypothetical protein
VAKKVEKWEAKDGRFFGTESEANLHELKLEVEEILLGHFRTSPHESFTNMADLANFLVYGDSLGDMVYVVRNNEKYNNLLMSHFEEKQCPHCGKF